MMQGFLIVAGFLAWLLTAVAIGCALVYGAGAVWQKWAERYERLIRASERQECGNRLVSASWWFSEDRITMDILAKAGTDMLSGGYPLDRVDSDRERWRTARLKSKGEVAHD